MDFSFITNLLQSPLSIGVIVGIVALLVFGKDAPLPISKLLTFLPKFSGSAAPAPNDHSCMDHLQCMLSCALECGDKEAIGKLVELVDVVGRLDSKTAHVVATKVSE